LAILISTEGAGARLCKHPLPPVPPHFYRQQLTQRWGYFGLIAAIYMLHAALSSSFANVVLVVFAAILFSLAAFDAFRKQLPETPPTLHGARMGGAYIAAFTAFIVVDIDLGIWGWLAPSAVGSPLIALGLWRFKNRRVEKPAEV